jgi:UDP-N-acetylmuramate dehydrogenase
MNIKKGLPGVKENILLKNYTTFKIGGLAKYFLVAKSKEKIIKTISTAKKLNLPFFILGGGSDTLVSDRGFKGLVIKVESRMLKVEGSSIYAETGVSLSESVSTALENNLSGLEWAAGIPGTIGGAIYGNAGAFGKSIGDSVRKVEVYDLKDNKIKIFKKRNCKFGYRNSIFKRKKNLIVLSVTIQLKKGNKKEIEKKIKEHLEYRKKTQPLNFPSIGSIFKNPSPSQVFKKFGRASGFSAGELGEEDKSSSLSFAAARMIEKCGLKGKTIGKAKISEKHGNFIVNLGGAKTKDVKKLIKLVKQKVKSKFGIVLEEEIQYLGFKN